MVETQNIINISLLAVVLVGLGFSVSSFNFASYQYYFCDERPEQIYSCQGFSKYSSEYGKCLNASLPGAEDVILGNKICKSGWQLISQDNVPVEPVINDSLAAKLPVLAMDIIVDGQVVPMLILDDSDDKLFTVNVGNKCLRFASNKPLSAKDLEKVDKQGGVCI